MDMNNIKAAFFDMDGVLLNTMRYHEIAWVKVFSEQGVEFSPELAHAYEGKPGRDTIREVIFEAKGEYPSDELVAQIYKDKIDTIRTYKPADVVENMTKVLDYLVEKGITIYVVTGSGQQHLIDRLSREFPNAISDDRIVSAKSVKRGKPFPDPYLLALEKSGCKLNEVFIVENAPLGVQSGKAADMFVYAINTGILPDQVLVDSGADVVVNNALDLLKEMKDR